MCGIETEAELTEGAVLNDNEARIGVEVHYPAQALSSKFWKFSLVEQSLFSRSTLKIKTKPKIRKCGARNSERRTPCRIRGSRSKEVLESRVCAARVEWERLVRREEAPTETHVLEE